MILNVHAPNERASKYMKQNKFERINRQIHNYIENFIIPLSTIYTTARKKFIKNIKEVSNIGQ